MWSAILCADWSKKATKREVYAAWPAEITAKKARDRD